MADVHHIACDGQTGKVIFEDQFSDEQGGWDFNEKYGLRLKAPGAEQTVAAAEGGTFTAQINETFNATQADYCVEAILPANAEKLAGGFGVLFLATDYNNYWVTRVLATGAVGLYKKVNNQWSTVWEVTNNGLPKTGASDLNSVRVVVKSGTITVLVNDSNVW